jgi:hypothetical protein
VEVNVPLGFNLKERSPEIDKPVDSRIQNTSRRVDKKNIPTGTSSETSSHFVNYVVLRNKQPLILQGMSV